MNARERVLAIDVGLGTADVLVWEPGVAPENSVKLVVPFRPQTVARQIRAATAAGETVVFFGPVMGGGASTKAMHDHVAAGLPFVSTADAALTFADNLELVRGHGVHLVSDEEARHAVLAGGRAVRSGDVDLAALIGALAELGIEAVFSGGAVAVQDHGFNPHSSNRTFRFSLWERALDERRAIEELFYAVDEIPTELTRMRAAAGEISGIPRVMVADTGPAALYGALEQDAEDAVLVNVGNGHTVCVVALGGRLAGVFEHHTSSLDRETLERWLVRFLAGEVTGDEVREAGPHRSLLADTSLEACFPAPMGDMMMTGCWGLLKAFRHRYGV